VAFRFRARLTAGAAALTVLAYLAQALAHPARRQPHALRFVLVQAGYLLWLGLAAVLLAALLERRTRRVTQLAEARRRLMVDALTAAERERRTLAEGLHDSAVQNLLSVRHELEEAGADGGSPAALRRADAALRETIGELREAIFELHPYILEQAGLEPALRAVAERAARRGSFKLRFELDGGRPYPSERLLLAAARELLANAAAHSGASSVTVRLCRDNGQVVLAVSDDGRGFDLSILPSRLAEGHIGILSQRERIESIGGRLEIRSAPGHGTTAEVRIP
jgi:two-component system, NarL family, sensor kinase